jgi:hypothetical protein
MEQPDTEAARRARRAAATGEGAGGRCVSVGLAGAQRQDHSQRPTRTGHLRHARKERGTRQTRTTLVRGPARATARRSTYTQQTRSERTAPLRSRAARRRRIWRVAFMCGSPWYSIAHHYRGSVAQHGEGSNRCVAYSTRTAGAGIGGPYRARIARRWLTVRTRVAPMVIPTVTARWRVGQGRRPTAADVR